MPREMREGRSKGNDADNLHAFRDKAEYTADHRAVSRKSAIIAVDWGTTNRRAYRIDSAGRVEKAHRDDIGVLALRREDFPREIAALRSEYGDLPVICAGMVGSARGWIELPYVPCPLKLADLAQQLYRDAKERTAVVPGVIWSEHHRTDVMRGEEVQFFGAVRAGLAPQTALLCQPGTHCKWATMVDSKITGFSTAMTGEIFSLLQRHSLLSLQMHATVHLDPDFLRGVEHAANGNLLSLLFEARADHVSGRGAILCTSSYVSGLLIGSDVAAALRDEPRQVYLLADAALGALYGAAIEALGGSFDLIDSHAAFAAGIYSIWEQAL